MPASVRQAISPEENRPQRLRRDDAETAPTRTVARVGIFYASGRSSLRWLSRRMLTELRSMV